MKSTPDHRDLLDPENDVTYLRAALKPFDPADRPRTEPTPRPAGTGRVGTHGGQGRARSARASTVLLTAAAAVAVIVGANTIPTLLKSTSPATAAQPHTKAAYLDCQNRVKSARPRDGVRSGPVAMNSSWAADPTLTSWYTTPKSDQLDAALRAALPTNACVFPGSGMGDLLFSEVTSIRSEAGVGPQLSPEADGRVVTPRGDGTLMVAVYRTPAGGSCDLATSEGTPTVEKFTAADGTRISRAVGSAYDDVTRWKVLLVQGARPDGSCVWLRLSDEVPRHDTSSAEGMTASGATPLTMDELTALATATGLATSS